MAAIIKIDQTGLSAGVAGRSRTDGLTSGAQVQLTSVSPGTTNAWSLLWVPDADTTAVASLTPAGAGATFSPTAVVYGTYRIRLVVDAGLPTESESIRTFSILTPNKGFRIPALNERASDAASLVNNGATIVALCEANALIAGGPFAAGNYGGWYPSLVKLFAEVESAGAVVGGGDIAARVTVTNAMSPYSVLTTDHVIYVNTTAGPITLTLPVHGTTNRIYEIIDIAGTLPTNNCTLARNGGTGTIGGVSANYIMEAAWQVTKIASNTTNAWWIHN